MGGLSEDQAKWVQDRVGSLLAVPTVRDLVCGILSLGNSEDQNVVRDKLWNNGKPLTLLYDRLQQLKTDNSTDLEKRLATCRASAAAGLLQELLHLATCAELPDTALRQLMEQFQKREVLYSGSHLEVLCLRELQVVFAGDHKDYLMTPVVESGNNPVGLKPGLILPRGPHASDETKVTGAPVTKVNGMEDCAIPRLTEEFGGNPNFESLISLLTVDVCLMKDTKRLNFNSRLNLVGTKLNDYAQLAPPKRVVVVFDRHSEASANSPMLDNLFRECQDNDVLKKHMGMTLFIVALDASQMVHYSRLILNYQFVSQILCTTATA